MIKALPVLLLLCLLNLLSACGGDPVDTNTGPETHSYDEAWPENMDDLWSLDIQDPAGDQVQMPPEQAGPPYQEIVPFPSVDVTRIRMGADADFVYLRVEYATTIPTAPVAIAAEGEVEAQTVGNQGMNVALNTDGDIQTGGGGEGVNGIDIFFALGFDFGRSANVYANWNFDGGDLHFPTYQELGELGEGGPGHDYALARYSRAEMAAVMPTGVGVDWGSWSEAESFNADGSLKYHHFAFDQLGGGQWELP